MELGGVERLRGDVCWVLREGGEGRPLAAGCRVSGLLV